MHQALDDLDTRGNILKMEISNETLVKTTTTIEAKRTRKFGKTLLFSISFLLISCSNGNSSQNTSVSQATSESSSVRTTSILIKEGSYQRSQSVDVFWVVRENMEPRLCEINWLKQYAGVSELQPGSAYKLVCEHEENVLPDIRDMFPWGGTSMSSVDVVSLNQTENGSSKQAKYIDGKIVDDNGQELQSPHELGYQCPHIVYDESNEAYVELTTLPDGSELVVTSSSYLPNCYFYLCLA